MQTIILENGLSYDADNDSFYNGVSHPTYAKYLKTRFNSVEQLTEHFINPMKIAMQMLEIEDRIHQLEIIIHYFKQTKPFTYKEAFAIPIQEFRALVFGSINVVEMINNLGNTRISVEGKEVTHRFYNIDGSYSMKTYDVIYELYEIDCSELGVENNFCVKCWCTTTNKEHWLWVEKTYAQKGPLEAIASTVRVYKNMIPYIKNIKRQGDVLLFEMTKKIKPQGEIVPLTAEQYFSKLIAQS